MGDGFTLFTIRGRKARALKVIIGTPLSLVGAGMVLVGLDSSGSGAFVPILIGAVFGLVGARYFYGAVRSDEFAVSLGSGSGRQDAGGGDV